MFSNYYIVGPTVELYSDPGSPSDQGDIRYGFELSITQNHRFCGTVKAQYYHNRIELEMELDQPRTAAFKTEVYRLFSRVVTGLRAPVLPLMIGIEADEKGVSDGLKVDGFLEHAGGATRAPGPFLLPEQDKVEHTHDVYQDLFHVPWNQATRDWSVLFKVAEDLGVKLGVRQATRPGMRILDLGCGTGKNTAVLESLGYEVHGLDLSEPAILRCRQLVQHPDRFLQGSAAALPWGDDYFDCVLDIGCLHCMPEPLRPSAVQEVARVLKADGTFYSRSFKPRDQDWLRTMPFKASGFGMEPQEVLGLLGSTFSAEIWLEDPRFNFVRARPKRNAAASDPRPGTP